MTWTLALTFQAILLNDSEFSLQVLTQQFTADFLRSAPPSYPICSGAVAVRVMWFSQLLLIHEGLKIQTDPCTTMSSALGCKQDKCQECCTQSEDRNNSLSPNYYSTKPSPFHIWGRFIFHQWKEKSFCPRHSGFLTGISESSSFSSAVIVGWLRRWNAFGPRQRTLVRAHIHQRKPFLPSRF